MLEFKEVICTVFYEDEYNGQQVDPCYSEKIEITHNIDNTITIDGKRYMIKDIERIIKNHKLFTETNKEFEEKIIKVNL
jgi:hypothetical protein